MWVTTVSFCAAKKYLWIHGYHTFTSKASLNPAAKKLWYDTQVSFFGKHQVRLRPQRCAASFRIRTFSSKAGLMPQYNRPIPFYSRVCTMSPDESPHLIDSIRNTLWSLPALTHVRPLAQSACRAFEIYSKALRTKEPCSHICQTTSLECMQSFGNILCFLEH